tara:strand:- start:390 stop:638 length:249 start_codon:yes stop_codon:yes gene_type:complete
MPMQHEIVPLYLRLTKECYDMLKYQAKKERWSMAGLTESILREALRKRQPGSISNENIFSEELAVKDLNIAQALDKMVQSNE